MAKLTWGLIKSLTAIRNQFHADLKADGNTIGPRLGQATAMVDALAAACLGDKAGAMSAGNVLAGVKAFVQSWDDSDPMTCYWRGYAAKAVEPLGGAFAMFDVVMRLTTEPALRPLHAELAGLHAAGDLDGAARLWGEHEWPADLLRDLLPVVTYAAKTLGVPLRKAISDPQPAASEATQSVPSVDNWLTVGDAAKAAFVNPGQITRAVNDGSLKSNGLTSRRRRIDKAALTDWMLKRSKKPEPRENDEVVRRKLDRLTDD